MNFTGTPSKVFRLWYPYADPSDEIIVRFNMLYVPNRRFVWLDELGGYRVSPSPAPPQVGDGAFMWACVAWTQCSWLQGVTGKPPVCQPPGCRLQATGCRLQATAMGYRGIGYAGCTLTCCPARLRGLQGWWAGGRADRSPCFPLLRAPPCRWAMARTMGATTGSRTRQCFGSRSRAREALRYGQRTVLRCVQQGGVRGGEGQG